MVKIKKTDNEKPIIAICYDFDKTLSPKDMQEYSLIPKLGCKAADFWKESNNYAKKEGMDKILSYMKLICDKCSKNDIAITDKEYRKMGKTVELFNGVDSWFDRINEFCNSVGVNVEHYIISAGLKEIIEGTKISNKFTEIFASSFVFDSYGKPIWPRQVVNYTSKTQYLFRINKGCTKDLSDEGAVNEYVEDEERRIPFRNFIYIGDSDTDIPAMKLVKKGGGYSLGVYNPSLVDIDKTSKLITQERIDFYAPADYSEGSHIDEIVKKIIYKIKECENLSKLNYKQKYLIESINYVKGFLPFIQNEIEEDPEKVDEIKKLTANFYKMAKKNLQDNNNDIFTIDEISKLIDKETENTKVFFTEKAKQDRALKKTKTKQIERNSNESNDKD